MPVLQSTLDPLVWWSEHEARFPLLANAAKQVLCIPASSAPSERIFSKAGLIVSDRMARLSASKVEILVFIAENLHHLEPITKEKE